MRKRISSFNIKGLNTSMPDISVPDGACEVLSNLRFQNGAWEPVGTFPPVKGGTFAIPVLHEDTITFLYAHEMDGDIHFIVKAAEEVDEGSNVFYNINLYDCFNGTTTLIGTFATVNNPQSYEEVDIRVSSFGNVLIVNTKDTMFHYIFSDGQYSLFSIPRPATLSHTISSRWSKDYDKIDNAGYFHWFLMDFDSKDIQVETSKENGSWAGEICLVAAYRMKDGTILSPSNLHIIHSEGTDENGSNPILYKTTDDDGKEFYSFRLKRNDTGYTTKTGRFDTIIPTLTISIPSGIDTNLIDRVAIYSTRINSLLDFTKIAATYYLGNGKDYSTFYADNELPNQPFYLLEEKNIGDITEGQWSFQIPYHKLKDIVTTPQTYIPPQVHSIFADAIYSYNSRIHYGGLTSTLFSHNPNFIVEVGPAFQNLNAAICERVWVGGVERDVYSQEITPIDQVAETRIFTHSPIISYPDYRATQLWVVGLYGQGRVSVDDNFKFNLKAAVANNVAYYIPTPTSAGKYPTLEAVESLPFSAIIPPHNPTFSEPNRIQVSAVDNPFSLPFQNSYAVGNEGSRVVAMNSVADALADSTFFGTYPLYIFTTDGIFALRAGSGEVLYAGTENVNHDRITNPTTIAVNGSVVYACSEGLKALSERTAVRISADIDSHNGVRRDWSTAQFAVNWRYGELICKLGDECFVWNIGAGAWSTRTDVLGHLRNGFIGQVDGLTITMHDVNDEQLGEVYSHFVTRPLKFESSEFKKIERMIARVAASQSIDWDVVLEGSNNCNTWITIKKGDVNSSSNIALRHLGNSFRYYRLSIGFTSASLATISQIDVALQDRFYRNLI